ncbi:hypothetical protein AB0M47_01710 [Hamadaea sp. NPDC051192]|uniref:hypothetical protein n=1 Tax=Hamadaea sp. NPDC051192 TaxID=3154940 RepID=UPI0034385448
MSNSLLHMTTLMGGALCAGYNFATRFGDVDESDMRWRRVCGSQWNLLAGTTLFAGSVIAGLASAIINGS